jgi:hypothetical protein
MRNALFRSLGLGALIVVMSCEPVDDGATTRAKGWDGVLTNNVLPKDRPIYLTIEEDPTQTAQDGCGKTTEDAHAILKNKCAGCHSTDAPAQGLPAWDFVLNDDKMSTATFTREGMTLRYMVPGDPDNSQIYARAVIARNMPPEKLDFNQPFYDRVTYSEGSVLREWIANCMGASPPVTGLGGSPGSTTGTGGASGSTTGTGGVSGGGTDGGTTPDPDAGTTIPMCATGVASSMNCNQGAVSPCALQAMTCTCTGAGGQRRRWMCN